MRRQCRRGQIRHRRKALLRVVKTLFNRGAYANALRPVLHRQAVFVEHRCHEAPARLLKTRRQTVRLRPGRVTPASRNRRHRRNLLFKPMFYEPTLTPASQNCRNIGAEQTPLSHTHSPRPKEPRRRATLRLSKAASHTEREASLPTWSDWALSGARSGTFSSRLSTHLHRKKQRPRHVSLKKVLTSYSATRLQHTFAADHLRQDTV